MAGPRTLHTYVQLNNWNGGYSKVVAYTWDMFFYLGCLVSPKCERKCLPLKIPEVPGWSATRGCLSWSENRRGDGCRGVGGVTGKGQ